MESDKPPIRPIVDEMEITMGEEQEAVRFAVRNAGAAMLRLSVRMSVAGATAHVAAVRDAHGRLKDVLASLEHALDVGNRDLSKLSAERLAAGLP